MRRELHLRVTESILRVEGKRPATAFFVNGSGLAITTGEAVGRRQKVPVILPDGRRLMAKVVARPEDLLDLALLEVPEARTRPLELGAVPGVEPGTYLAAVGYGPSGEASLSVGHLARVMKQDEQTALFVAQLPTEEGVVGAPVIDREGHVVGIVTGLQPRRPSFARILPTAAILASFPRLLKLCPCLLVRAPFWQPISVDGEPVGVGPAVVVDVGKRRSVKVSATIDGKPVERVVRVSRERVVDLTVE